MFEKQYGIKDTSNLKNKINQNFKDKYKCEINDKIIIIKNKNEKIVFKGNILSNPLGCVIKGEFPVENIIRNIAAVVVCLYVVFLLGTFFMGFQLYDYQILLMVIGAGVLVLFKRIILNKTGEIKEIFDKIQ